MGHVRNSISKLEYARVCACHLAPEDKYTARLAHVQSCESDEGREAVEEFFQMAVASKSEGLMVKVRGLLLIFLVELC